MLDLEAALPNADQQRASSKRKSTTSTSFSLSCLSLRCSSVAAEGAVLRAVGLSFPAQSFARGPEGGFSLTTTFKGAEIQLDWQNSEDLTLQGSNPEIFELAASLSELRDSKEKPLITASDPAMEAFLRGKYPAFAARPVEIGKKRGTCCWKKSSKSAAQGGKARKNSLNPLNIFSTKLSDKEKWKRWAAWTCVPEDNQLLEQCLHVVELHAMVISALARRARAGAGGSQAPFVNSQGGGICEAFGEAHVIELEEIPEQGKSGHLDKYADELTHIVARRLPKSHESLEKGLPRSKLYLSNHTTPTWLCDKHMADSGCLPKKHAKHIT